MRGRSSPWVLLVSLFVVACGGSPQAAAPSAATSPDATPAPGPPVDKPFASDANATAAIQRAIQPFTEDALRTYPEARRRYLAGLPKGQRFFVTTVLRDETGRFEQVFIDVKGIEDGHIEGVIASDILTVKGYSAGQAVQFPEQGIVDWTIQRKDGSEEGNRVGRFLDYYRPGKVFAAVFGVTADARGHVTSSRLARMIDPATGSPAAINFDPPQAYLSVVKASIAATKYRRLNGAKEFFVVFYFDPLHPERALEMLQRK